MNTKLFFLLLVSFFISTSTSSLVASKFDIELHIENKVSSKKDHQADPIDVQPIKWSPDHTKIHGEKTPMQPEDGKHHHFHFSRIENRIKRRALQLLACKIILTIAHISCFLYCFFHVFH
jgi:hypothetical protein